MQKSKKLLIGVVGAAIFSIALAGCSKSEPKDSTKEQTAVTAAAKTTDTTTHTAKDQTKLLNDVSYTLGYSVGHNVTAQLQGQGATLDTAELLAGFKKGAAEEKGKFTDAQMQSIMQAFQQQLINQQQQKQVAGVLKSADTLLNSQHAPTVGPKNAKVAVIEFFDYNCMFCSKIAPVVEKVMDENPNVKYIFKEFPIFGQRWESSQYAAEMGLAVYQLKGAEAYIKYHNGVFATGNDEGKLTVADVKKAAAQAGVDVTKAESVMKDKNITGIIKSDMDLGFTQLGIQGTPAIIVMPTSGANAQNTTVIPGFAPKASIQAAIDKAQGK